jgi:hypothetical protein
VQRSFDWALHFPRNSLVLGFETTIENRSV